MKCHYIKAEEITWFHQRNRMISENAWNALMRNEGSIYKLYPSWEGYSLYKRDCNDFIRGYNIIHIVNVWQ